jgi:outer membrane lipoprotein-sorting protein
MRRLRTAAMTLGVAALAAATPGAGQDGTWILERVDSVLTAPKDMTATQRVTLIDADGSEKTRLLRTYQKGPDRRLARFVTPAEVRDAGFLRLADDQMYLYLPAFRRVRRIASSIKHERFMGTDLSYEDLSRTRFGDDYRVVDVGSAENGHRLTLEARPGTDVGYARIVMVVAEDTWVVTSLEMQDRDGKLVKTVTASRIEQVQGYWLARRVDVQAARDGHRTVLEMEDIHVDTGLTDDFFTQRQLKSGS